MRGWGGAGGVVGRGARAVAEQLSRAAPTARPVLLVVVQ